MRVEPFVELACWWHLFPLDITFVTTKDVNLELGLESPKVLNL